MTSTDSPTLSLRRLSAAPGASALALALFLGLLGAHSVVAQPDLPAQPVLPAKPAKPAKPDLPRIGRQIRIMEKVIDQVLVESQHAIVTGSPNCRGMRLEGYGVLFVVELSPLSSEGGMFHFQFKEDGSYNVVFDEDDDGDKDKRRTEGRIRNTGRRDDSESTSDIEYDQDEGADDEEKDKDKEKDKRDRERELEQKAKEIAEKERLKEWVKHLENGANPGSDAGPEREAALQLVRDELVGALRDYGYTITGLKPDEHVAIAIFPSDLDWRAPDTRIIIQVKRGAIDAYNESRLTPEEFAKQVEVHTQ